MAPTPVSTVPTEQPTPIQYIRSPRAETYLTQDGTREWIPYCVEDKKPREGMVFKTLEKAIEFYKDREGILESEGNYEEKGKRHRKRNSKRVGCKARIIWNLNNEVGEYKLTKLFEPHNHSRTSMPYLRSSRKMTMVHKNFVNSNTRMNIGPTKSFRLFKENVGSYDNVGATIKDFMNFHRDLKEHIKGDDAKMLIENFIRKRDVFNGFYFDYSLDEHDHVSHLFWADATSRKNYSLFGEMISFDCTYDSNTYSMVLAPFIGVDHHKSCITFGVGLLSKEDAQSFEWLFRTFLNAMGNCEPRYLITNQDPAMKVAINEVFSNTRHRLCLWHIMKKVPEKVGPELKQDEGFLKLLNECVWDMEQESEEFEATWNSLMVQYNLVENGWFQHMFSIREHWIPCYFRDLRLGGILRTTSRSESENSFFINFTNPHVTLVEFYMRFESAMDAQRHKQDKLNTESIHSVPQFITPLPLEKHAAEVYTRNFFYMFQDEVYKACFRCGISSIRMEENIEIAQVMDHSRQKTSEVTFNSGNLMTSCSCELFERLGILCKYAICVLNARQVTKIPEYYILDLWTKEATKRPIFYMHGNFLEECRKMNTTTKMLGEVWSEIFNCVGLAEGNEEYLQQFLDNLRDFSKNLVEKGKCVPMTKTQEMELFFGPSASSNLNIQNPIPSKNKGKRHRIVGEKEVAIEQSQKPKRKCKACGAYDYHDSRNCPNKTTT
ncbi:protein FAR1-RELATED SEQUENCE 9-like [Spinacia oleracea]|uniref:Protein FAR1-RELATED SEQUENCE 9-like n=1 Tax=Spinacia oleracea TaxID=3562 RepID=A0A9R0J8L6_SPIOL|nr:protein FAR1-RELATED SEQUENCE 9-like [Spinacia oleracea]